VSVEEEESKREVIDTAGDLIKALAQFSPGTPIGCDGQDGPIDRVSLYYANGRSYLMIVGGRME
jgi:hypothetical protein